jgi:RHS repeat-associated protein
MRLSRGPVGALCATVSLVLVSVLESGAAHAQSKAAVSPQAIAVPKGEGSAQGMGESFSGGSSTGGLQYTVPIALPAARGGAAPSLSLSYASGGGSGNAGIGWNLPVAFIARQTDKGVPQYRDAANGAWSPEQDRFVFAGGQELVPLCTVRGGACAAAPGESMPAWADGWQHFRARVEGGFLRFFWSPGRETWRVQAKSGVTLELGVPLDGSGRRDALEADPAQPMRIYRWNVAREYDNQGFDAPAASSTPTPANVVVYRYLQDGGTAYLEDVHYVSAVRAWRSPRPEDFAHHVRFAYERRPDATTGYRRGWAATDGLRLRRVDVTSNGTGSGRELVRRYHLRYRADRTASLLEELWHEGRCATPIAENDHGALTEVTDCPRQPSMRFRYSEGGGDGALVVPNVGRFSQSVRAVTGAPRRELAERNTDFLDVNGDGLLDIVRTAASTAFPEHSVQLNGAGGVAGAFADPVPLGPAPGSINAQALAFASGNVVPLDLDGDGVTELLHMPAGPTSRAYVPQRTASGFRWVPRPLQTPRDGAGWLDVTGTRLNVRVMDVNADGLVDIVVTDSSRIRTFLNLGRFPGGAGRFGSATWTGPETAALSDKPIDACIPGDDQTVQFAREEIRLADMNGDGLVDIVRLHSGRIVYWPGRGDGSWGNVPPIRCAPRPPGARAEVTMTNSPAVRPGPGEFVDFLDVNGDGLDDVVQVAGRDVFAYFNRGGTSFEEAPLRVRNPELPTVRAELVRLTDIDGSGTLDVVLGSASGWQYLDLLGGTRPNVLVHVENGRGTESDFDYEPSSRRMLAAAEAGAPWRQTMPMVTTALVRSVVTERVGVNGQPPPPRVVTYDYRDPLYDPNHREFRGFAEVLSRVHGDATHPTSTSRAVFLLGECVDETPDDGIADCELEGRFRDNRREALKGLVAVAEEFDERGVYTSTRHTTYRLRELYVGLDGRRVRHAFPSRENEWRYDTSPFVPVSESIDVTDVELEGASGSSGTGQVTRQVTLRSLVGRARLAAATDVDRYGNTTASTAFGCVEGCIRADEAITRRFEHALIDPHGSGWLWRPRATWIEGSTTSERRSVIASEYDGHGNLIVSRAHLVGSLPLTRRHEVPGRAIAPPPTGASSDGWIVVAAHDYDTFGNLVFDRGANARCRDVQYDDEYAAYALVQRSWVGPMGPAVRPGAATATFADAAGGAGCGTVPMQSVVRVDRGTGAVLEGRGPHGELTRAAYDGFGRLVALYPPDELALGEASATPSVVIAYEEPSDARPYSVVRVASRGGAGASYRESFSAYDGGGERVLAVEQADPSARDGGRWVVSGRVERDAKGAVFRAYEPVFGDENPILTGLRVPASAYTEHEHDAFGREVRRRDRTGDVVEETRYHALASDAWDAADLDPAHPQYGTYNTTLLDGHGRPIVTAIRERRDGVLDVEETRTEYLPSGETLLVDRVHAGSGDAPVRRWARYDSLGRLVLNVEPHTTKNFDPNPAAPADALLAVRYAYDDSGKIVGTSDARGCGVNFFYEAGGRPLAQDYSPCRDDHELYTTPDLATGHGTEVYNVWDRAPADAPAECTPDARMAVGTLVATLDRGRATMTALDARGRVACVATRVAKPGSPAPKLDERFASDWYVRKTAYDAADRPTSVSTGATVPALFAPDGTSAVYLRYTQRGLVGGVDSSYGALLAANEVRADGLASKVTYGDLSRTTTTFAYDSKLRLGSVLTYRGPPPLWSTLTPTYPPVPSDAPNTLQRTLQAVSFGYDALNNPTALEDFRDPAEWPDAAKPASRRIAYDGRNRVARVDYEREADDWVSPFDNEVRGRESDVGSPHPHRAFRTRVRWQTFAYDWLGNLEASDDDQHAFFDRSTGRAAHASSEGKPYQLKEARSGERDRLRAAYDESGYLRDWAVEREGTCLPAGAVCSHRYAYEWDEVGNLSRARRWDRDDPGVPGGALPGGPADAELTFAYDGGGARVRKTVGDGANHAKHDVYLFDSLELRGARFADGRYEANAKTQNVYVGASGVRARVKHAEEDLPAAASGKLHLFLSIRDYLGSGDIVIDHATSELVEATTFLPLGAVESDYRPERWGAYREREKFTGKEDDVQLGLVYFGKRYLAPALGRWISPDPLAVHSGGADPNLYAYVRGRVFAAVDPNGLNDEAALPMVAADGRGYTLHEASIGDPICAVLCVRETQVTAVWDPPSAPNAGVGPANDPMTPYFVPAVGPSKWAYEILARSKDRRRTVNQRIGDMHLAGALSLFAIVEDTLRNAAMAPGRSWAGNRESAEGLRDLHRGDIRGGLSRMMRGELAKTEATIDIFAAVPIVRGVGALLKSGGRGLVGATEKAVANITCPCFTEETLVDTEDGKRPIATLRVGDRVWAEDPDTGVKALRRVARVFITPEKETIGIALRGEGDRVEVIRATAEHPFWVEGRGWLGAAELGAGDRVRGELGPQVVEAVWTEPSAGTVYNLEVEGLHTYRVGAGGVLVHNNCCNLTGGGAALPAGTRFATEAEKQAASALARDVAAGHAFEKHVVQRGEFPMVTDRDTFATGVERVITSPETIVRDLQGNRTGFYHSPSNTLVITKPGAEGTMFRPEQEMKYFMEVIQ